MTEKPQLKPSTLKRVANLSPEGNAAKMIQEAEKVRAIMFEVPVKFNTSQIDEDYQMIDSHLDDSLKHKIQAFEYVDFARLISKNKSLRDEERQRLEIVNKNGMSFLSPVAEGNIMINSYGKWEQAFRIYSNVLTTKFPAKSTELLQYNHTIHSASSTYVWDNVYAYDKEFRHHIARHPYRSWGVILEAWTMLLKDRARSEGFFQKGSFNKMAKKGKICKRFNRGRCMYGLLCKYEHRCAIPKCGKFGHGAHVCGLRGQDYNGPEHPSANQEFTQNQNHGNGNNNNNNVAASNKS